MILVTISLAATFTPLVLRPNMGKADVNKSPQTSKMKSKSEALRQQYDTFDPSAGIPLLEQFVYKTNRAAYSTRSVEGRVQTN